MGGSGKYRRKREGGNEKAGRKCEPSQQRASDETVRTIERTVTGRRKEGG